MDAPKVSVCIPAFAQPTYLRRALGSLAEQEFSDFEVVISDDSPDDALEPVVTAFRDRLRIVYRRNGSLLGPAANCNQALDLAQGELLKVLHHDDWLPDPGCLGDWVQLLDSRPDADFAFAASLAFDCWHEGGVLQERLAFCHQATRCQLSSLASDPAEAFRYNLVGAPSATLFRRGVTARFDPRLQYLVDIDFYLSVLTANRRFAYTRRPLAAVTGRTDAGGKVTDFCQANPSLLVFEWVYTYRKLVDTVGFRESCFAELVKVLRRYGIRSGAELKDCGVDFALPLHLRAWSWTEQFVREPGRRAVGALRGRSSFLPRPGKRR